MCRSFLHIRDALLMEPKHLLVRTINAISTCQPFDLREVGYSVHTDKMEHNQVCLHERTDGICLKIPLRKIKPAPQKRLHLLKTNTSRCRSERSVTRPRRDTIRETAEKLAVLHHKSL